MNSIEDQPWMILNILKNFSTGSRCRNVQQQLAIQFVENMSIKLVSSREPTFDNLLERTPSSPNLRRGFDRNAIKNAIIEAENNVQKGNGTQSGLLSILKALEDVVIDDMTDYQKLYLLSSGFSFCLGTEGLIRTDPLLPFVTQRLKEIDSSIKDPGASFMNRTKVKNLIHTLFSRLSLCSPKF